MADPKHLLNLNRDDPEAPAVSLDGQVFPLKPMEEFTPMEARQHRQRGRRLEELMDREELTPDEVAELEALPDELCRAVLPSAPDEVHQRLTYAHRVRVLKFFLGLRGSSRVPGAQTNGTN